MTTYALDSVKREGKRKMDAEKSIEHVSLDDILEAGVALPQAKTFYYQLQNILSQTGDSRLETWQRISNDLLSPTHPHALHQLMYYSTYETWDISTQGPPLAWFPTPKTAQYTNLGRVLEKYGKKLLGTLYQSPLQSFPAFQKYSVQHPEVYWSIVFEELSILFHRQPTCILDKSDHSQPGGRWLPGAMLNIAECCLSPKKNKTNDSYAVVWRDEENDDSPLISLSLLEFRAKVSWVANALDKLQLQRGDAIAIDMPMDCYAVMIYLAIILAGYVVVSIADSFVPREIEMRLRISKAKVIFTQDKIVRGGKVIALYSRVIDAHAPTAIVLPSNGKSVSVKLRSGDLAWNTFMSFADDLRRPDQYIAVKQPVYSYTNILFSSGTTGEPKAIPWTHATPLRCAGEAWAHLDIRQGDVISWPTNLGWMVGPLVLYSALLNGATIALYKGSPLGRGFGKFVQDAGVTILGTVPSIVKTWKKTGCMDSLDWSRVRHFATTGEASSLDDDLWLSGRNRYKPIFESCGGTELGSAFVGGCPLQPQAFAAFSTPSMSISFVILNDSGIPYPDDQPCIGELAIIPTMLGASTTLLNADHNAVYFKNMPLYNGMPLRRHGDLLERMVGGYYKAHGRADDTMNLGGIKTSAIEIEQVCNRAHERVLETAAISMPPPGGGPEQLIIISVLKDGPPINAESLKQAFASAIHSKLNPLFKVSSVAIVPDFPRTASNKIMRRSLRSQFGKAGSSSNSKL
ncbi:hypothetical protein O6H91_11G022600 [Diphasiastrum complanatum]|uniref:Uncharacterized protein n=1 Tax=Diphasiastrum complanatum TaxID=34168 RepID=A0ACC2C6Y4_DIPCM|nr:hypothetical protein O6H91_11G022600 [Diphasiastrum complanatum]